MTLTQIADFIAGRLNKPFDEVLKDSIKFSIKTYRALIVRRDFERNPLSKEFLQSMTVDVVKVDKADTCVINVGCPVLRTKNKIPKPVRLNSDTVFKFVGSVDRSLSFTYTELEELPYTFENTFTSKILRFNWTNGYLYIFNRNKIKFLTIEAIFADPTLVMDDCSDTECFTDDSEFPLGDDMIQMIITGMLAGNSEYKLLKPDDQEVKIDTEETLANTRRQ